MDIPLITKNRLIGRGSSIPEEFRDQLNNEFARVNISREKILAVILIIISILLILSDTHSLLSSGRDIDIYVRFIYIYTALILISLVFLFAVYLKDRYFPGSLILTRVLHNFINIFVITLCALSAVYTASSGGRPFSYMVSMFCIASSVLLSPFERAYIYLFPYAFYVTGLFIVNGSLEGLVGDIIFSTLLVITAIVVSGLNFSSYVKNYISGRVIMQKNDEINRMYRLTEEELKKRTIELNEAVEYEKLRTAFFSNISHEFRTPLNVIFSAQQMLELVLENTSNHGSKGESRQYMWMIKQNCYRLIRLINNLIDITKIDAGYFQLSLKNCDIVKVVEDITLSVAKYIKSRNINVIFDTEIEEKIVTCDPDSIERIMLNLFSNAVKFTPKGGDIFVNIYEYVDKISIHIRDTGLGIPPEMQKLVYERFVQVDKTTVRAREGSGIGLSIVKALVDMHKGNISLTSEPGKGSQFIIEIPDRVDPSLEYADECDSLKEGENNERINIEFSDIYS